MHRIINLLQNIHMRKNNRFWQKLKFGVSSSELTMYESIFDTYIKCPDKINNGKTLHTPLSKVSSRGFVMWLYQPLEALQTLQFEKLGFQTQQIELFLKAEGHCLTFESESLDIVNELKQHLKDTYPIDSTDIIVMPVSEVTFLDQ